MDSPSHGKTPTDAAIAMQTIATLPRRSGTAGVVEGDPGATSDWIFTSSTLTPANPPPRRPSSSAAKDLPQRRVGPSALPLGRFPVGSSDLPRPLGCCAQTV